MKMKIRIQSKSGDCNGVMDLKQATLLDTLKYLRLRGGYLIEDGNVAVPFEEIEFITEDD